MRGQAVESVHIFLPAPLQQCFLFDSSSTLLLACLWRTKLTTDLSGKANDEARTTILVTPLTCTIM